MGGYLGLLNYAVYLSFWSRKVRPVRRWNYLRKRWEHRHPAFDWVIFGVTTLPPVLALSFISTVYLLKALGV